MLDNDKPLIENIKDFLFAYGVSCDAIRLDSKHIKLSFKQPMSVSLIGVIHSLGVKGRVINETTLIIYK
jgi:hypothetical protein